MTAPFLSKTIQYWFDYSTHTCTIFSFFLERNMLSFFLKIMNQKCGSYVCVQLLQTLNILFENIRNETSICKFNVNYSNL